MFHASVRMNQITQNTNIIIKLRNCIKLKTKNPSHRNVLVVTRTHAYTRTLGTHANHET